MSRADCWFGLLLGYLRCCKNIAMFQVWSDFFCRQIVVLFKASPSPLLFLFPNPKAGHIPFSIPLTLLYIAIHANLLVLTDIPNGILQSSQALPLKFLYPLAAVAPSLSIYLRNPWQVSIWWCTTFTMVYLTQFILDTIEDQNYQVAQLEGLRYRAPGA